MKVPKYTIELTEAQLRVAQKLAEAAQEDSSIPISQTGILNDQSQRTALRHLNTTLWKKVKLL